MMFFNPWGFLALAAVLGLAAIYFLQRRFRRRTVSSLLLWQMQKLPEQGGRRWRRLRTPAPFWLELLALLLLALAAAAPHVKLGENRRPLAVVLDDSYSMRAGAPDSARERAREALVEELRDGGHHPIHLVLAGGQARVLAESLRDPQQAENALEGWRCQAPRADLRAAAALGRKLAGRLGRVLVLSDRGPPPNQAGQRHLQWAFGQALPNVALVNGGRSAGSPRSFLEVANLSDSLVSTRFAIDSPGREATAATRTIELGPRESKRVAFEWPPGEALRVRLPDDSLHLDNQATLLPAARPPLRVEMQVADQQLRPLLERALTSTRNAVLTSRDPELLFTERPSLAPSPLPEDAAWPVHVLSESSAQSYAGPLVVDRTHPLAEGLSLRALIWGGGSGPLPGVPIVLADQTPLLSARPTLDGRQEIWLRLRPSFSNLQRTPDWPILIANILQWRSSRRLGPQRQNLRLGEQAAIATGRAPQAEIAFPDGQTRHFAPGQGRLAFTADQAGVYRVGLAGRSFRFAANPFHRGESDLSGASSGRWGEWADETARRWEYRDLSWLPLLAALAVLLAHQLMIRSSPASGGAA